MHKGPAMSGDKARRTSVTLQPPTLARLKRYQARVIGEQGDPQISMDTVVDRMLTHVETCPHDTSGQ